MRDSFRRDLQEEACELHPYWQDVPHPELMALAWHRSRRSWRGIRNKNVQRNPIDRPMLCATSATAWMWGCGDLTEHNTKLLNTLARTAVQIATQYGVHRAGAAGG